VLGKESGKVEVTLFEESRIVQDGFLRDFEVNRRFEWDPDVSFGDFANGVEEVGIGGEVVVRTWDAVR
jgi:hypothetical protein